MWVLDIMWSAKLGQRCALPIHSWMSSSVATSAPSLSTAEAFSQAWGQTLDSWDSLDFAFAQKCTNDITQADRDEFTGTVGMTPAELFPVWNLRYSHVHTYDDPETIDQIRKTLLLDTSWRPLKNFHVDYTYTRVDREERTLDFDTLQQTHFGIIGYSQNFWDRRLALNTAYTINYNKF